jgi:hypothetical protein
VTLPVDGRRSVYAAWPPGAVCEKCQVAFEEGYVGPVEGDSAVFPDQSTRFVCEGCVRSALGLRDGELEHNCQDPHCTDNVHVELRVEGRGALVSLSDAERVEHYAAEYAENGWRVTQVTDAPWAPKVIGLYWAVWIEQERTLPWSVQP